MFYFSAHPTSSTNFGLSCENRTETITIELRDGKSISLAEENKRNFLIFRKIQSIKSWILLLLQFLAWPYNLYYIIMFAITAQSFSNYQIVFALLISLNFLLFSLKEVFSEIFLRSAELKFNKGLALRADLSKNSFDPCEISQLIPGDLVLLQENEEIPADLLILDTSEFIDKQAVCYADSRKLDESSAFCRKLASSLTSVAKTSPFKGQIDKYKEIFNGGVQFRRENGYFKGFLRLSKDPKVDLLTNDNVLCRGSVLVRTCWVLGLVLYTGRDCECMRNFERNLRKKDAFKEFLQKYFFVIFAVYLLLALLTLFLQISKKPAFPNDFVNIFSFFAVVFPLEGYFLIELVHIFNGFTKKNLYNSSSFANLSTVDYLIVNKTSVISAEPAQLSQIYVDSHIYQFSSVKNRENLEESTKKIKKIAEFSQLDCDIEFKSEHTPKLESNIEKYASKQKILKFMPEKPVQSSRNLDNSESKDPILVSESSKNHDLLESNENNIPIITSNMQELSESEVKSKETMILRSTFLNNLRLGSKEFAENVFCNKAEENLLHFLMVCQQTRQTAGNLLENALFQGFSWEDQAIIEFCKQWGFQMCEISWQTSKKSQVYCYNYHGFRKKSVEILAVFPQTAENCSFSAIYRENSENPAVLLTRARKAALLNKLSFSEEEREKTENILVSFENQGLIPLILARKSLSLEEERAILTKYRILKASLVNQQEQISCLLSSIDSDYECVAVLGFEEKLQKDSEKALSFFKNCLGTKLWLCSGDCEERVRATARKLAFSQETSILRKSFTLEGNSAENLIFTVKSALSFMGNYVKEHKKLSILTNSRNSSLISRTFLQNRENEVSKPLEITLFLSGRSLEIIKETPYLLLNFRFICSMITTLVAYELTGPQKAWLARMIQRDFRRKFCVLAVGTGFDDGALLQTADFGAEIQGFGLGDAVFRDFAEIQQCARSAAGSLRARLAKIAEILAYKALLAGFECLFFEFFSQFAGEFLNWRELLAYSAVVLTGNTAYFVVSAQKSQVDGLEKSTKFETSAEMKRSLGLIAAEALFHAIIVFYTTGYNLRNCVDSLGNAYDKRSFEICCFLANVLVTHLKVFKEFDAKFSVKNLWVFINPFAVLLIFFAVWNAASASSLKDEFSLVIYMFSDGKLMLVCGFAVGLCEIFSFLWGFLVFFLRNCTRRKRNSWKFQWRLVKTVRKIFENPKYMDPVIQEMFHTEDPNAQVLYIKPLTLRIFDSKIEKRYLQARKQKSIKFARIYYCLFLLIASVYAFSHFFMYPITAMSYLKIALIGAGALFFLFLNTHLFDLLYSQIIILTIFIAISCKILFDWISASYSISLAGSLVSLMSTCSLNLSINIIYILIMNIIHQISLTILTILNIKTSYSLAISQENLSNLDSNYKFSTGFSLILLQISLMILCYFLNYASERQKRSDFLDSLQISADYHKCQDILSILVPRFVQTNMNKGQLTMSEEQERVSILFIDISNFDEILAFTNKNMINLLDSLYREYDSLCVSNGVQKLETVGKTYMVASGLKIYEVDIPEALKLLPPPYKLVKLAFEMLKYLREVTISKGGLRIEAKIGIHSGNVIAGVIGHHKPQFSLIGDTVNTASRVCSTAEIDTVTISKQGLLDYGKLSQYVFKERVVQAKGKGDLCTYQVEKFCGENSKFRKNMSKALKSLKAEGHNSKKKDALKLGQMVAVFKEKNQQVSSINSLKSSFFTGKSAAKSIENNNVEERRSHSNFIEITQKKGNLENFDKEDENLSENEEKSAFNMNILTPKGVFLLISYTQSKIYRRFQRENIENYLKEIRVLVAILFFTFLIRTLVIINSVRNYSNTLIIYLFRASFNVLIIVPGLKLSLSSEKSIKLYKISISLICYLGYLSCLFENKYFTLEQNQPCVILEAFLIYVVQSNLVIYSFIETLLNSVILIVLIHVALYLDSSNSIEQSFIIIMFVTFTLLKANFSLRNHIKNFNNRMLEESKKHEQEELVSQLLPKHVYDKLKKVMNNHKVDLSDQFDTVTILFADIAGFTKYSSAVKPSQVVSMLRLLFTEFDRQCLQHHIYKVYTIGDCYVAMGMLDCENRDPLQEAKNIIAMGFSMISIIRKVREDIDFKDLDMRIGVHTGQVLGGIVGVDLVRYDIYGQDVLIANKMESNGTVGEIMVSNDTKKLLEKDPEGCVYEFKFKKQVFIKTLEKTVDCFLLNIKGE